MHICNIYIYILMTNQFKVEDTYLTIFDILSLCLASIVFEITKTILGFVTLLR